MATQSPLQIGRECFLTAMDRTLVVDILGLSGETIWVTYPMADSIKEGTSAELSLHEANGFVGFHTRVTSAPKPNQQGIMLERTESAEPIKPRKHWRVTTNLTVSIKVSGEEQYHEATLRDLSIEGGLITTPIELAAGSKLEMLFQLPNDNPHAILLQVVYCHPTPKKGGNRYGLHFIEMNEAANAALMLYLYEKIHEAYPQQLCDLYPRPAKRK